MRQSGTSQPLLINMYLPGTRDQPGAGGTGTRGWKSGLGHGKGIAGVQGKGRGPETRTAGRMEKSRALEDVKKQMESFGAFV